MHAASRAVLLFEFAGTAACTGTVPAQNAGMAPDAAESVIEAPPATDAELLNTYWKILVLAGEPVSVAPGKSKQWRIEGTLPCEAAYLE
jgi:hypothetical protein